MKWPSTCVVLLSRMILSQKQVNDETKQTPLSFGSSRASPYLLSLGLSKSMMAIVFLAGPLSGLIVQPLVGVLSDGCRSSLGRRRPFIIGGCIVSSFAVLLLGWSKEVAGWFTTNGSKAVSLPDYPWRVNGSAVCCFETEVPRISFCIAWGSYDCICCSRRLYYVSTCFNHWETHIVLIVLGLIATSVSTSCRRVIVHS